MQNRLVETPKPLPKTPSAQRDMTSSLLEEFQHGRAELLSGELEKIHVGSGKIDSEERRYLFLHPPASLRFNLSPGRVKLMFGLGLHPDVWDKPQVGPVEFIVSSDDDVLFRMVIDPIRFEEHRRWQDVCLHLPASPYPTRKLTLATRGVGGEDYRWALWSDLGVQYQNDSDTAAGAGKDKSDPYISYPLLFPAKTRFFFVLGSMKSGTTWLTNVLNSHPEICCRGEMHSIEMLDALSPRLTLEYVSKSSALLREWYTMSNNGWNLPFREGESRKRAFDSLDKDFVRFFYEWTMVRFLQARKQRIPALIGDKSPTHTPMVVEKLSYYFGCYRPYIVHVIRDPRDVAVSHWFHLRRKQHEGQFNFVEPFRGPEDKRLCEKLLDAPDDYMKDNQTLFYYPRFLGRVFNEWISVNEILSREGSNVFGDRYILIRYEDLKTEFAATLKSILERFEVDPSDDVIEAIRGRTDVNNLKNKPNIFRKGVVGDWKNYFRDREIELFKKEVLPMSRQFGYCE